MSYIIRHAYAYLAFLSEDRSIGLAQDLLVYLTMHPIQDMLMKYALITMLAGLLLLAGCAKMINTATSDYFIEECVAAEQNARLLDADAICTRAIFNIDWSKQKPEVKSQQFYKLGQMKRQLYKYSEAILLFRESLAIEEEMPNPSDLRIGLRLVELSLSLAGRDKWEEGLLYLERALPIVSQFTGEERKFAAKVLGEYGVRYRKMGEMDVAGKFESAAAALQ